MPGAKDERMVSLRANTVDALPLVSCLSADANTELIYYGSRISTIDAISNF